MPKTIILNQNNIVQNSGNSTFLYEFPMGGVNFKDDLIALQLVNIYNSVYNITSVNNNNSFSYTWIDGSVVSVNLPDSNLSLAELNATLQNTMVQNKHYLVSGSSYIYLLEIVINASRYANQINSFQISSAIATANSWTLPSGATWVLPTNSINPIFTVPSTNFQSLIGFKAGNYPNATITGVPPSQIQTPTYTSSQSFLSYTAPQINPQPTYLCACSLVNNRLSVPSQLISSITPQDVKFGGLFTYQIADLVFCKIEDGNYTNFTFRFIDNLGNPIIFQDPNTLILLIIKNKSEF